MKIKKFFQLLLIPDSFFNLSRIGKILIIEYLFSIQLFGVVIFSSIPYQEIHGFKDTLFHFFIFFFFYLLILFSFFYLNTSFAEWILQITLGKFSTKKLFFRFLTSLFIFFLCFAGFVIVSNMIHPIFSCGCASTTLDDSTINTIN
jgi:hypothetical protein